MRSLRLRPRPRSIAGGLAAALVVIAAVLLAGDGRGGAPVTLAGDVPQAIFAQFADQADTIYIAAIDDIGAARELTTIRHAGGWGIIGAVSPDGRWLAYNVLPPGARDPRTQARAYLLPLAGGSARLVTDGVDLKVKPVWASGSDRVAFLRGGSAADGEGAFTVLTARPGGGATEEGTIAQALAIHPVGFASEGDALYVSVLDRDGTRVEALSDNGRRSILARLSIGLARDFALSPSGRSLAYVDTAPEAGMSFRVRVADLGSGLATADAALSVAGPSEATLGPAWTPSGELTFATVRQGDAVRTVSASLTASSARPVAPPSPAGFDVPLSWSPDGSGLAVRSVTGALGDVLALELTLVSRDGARRSFGNADTKFLGWVPARARN